MLLQQIKDMEGEIKKLVQLNLTSSQMHSQLPSQIPSRAGSALPSHRGVIVGMGGRGPTDVYNDPISMHYAQLQKNRQHVHQTGKSPYTGIVDQSDASQVPRIKTLCQMFL